MRLWSCLLIEIAVGTSLVFGLGAAVHRGPGVVRDALEGSALAATLTFSAPAAVEPLRRGDGNLISPVEAPPLFDPNAAEFALFDGVRDELLLSPLAS